MGVFRSKKDKAIRKDISGESKCVPLSYSLFLLTSEFRVACLGSVKVGLKADIQSSLRVTEELSIFFLMLSDVCLRVVIVMLMAH